MDNTVILWSIKSGHIIKKINPNEFVYSVAISTKSLVFGTKSKSILIWNSETNELEAELGNYSFIWSLFLTEDEDLLITGSLDGYVSIWNFNQRVLIREVLHSGFVTTISVTKDKKFIVSGSKDGILRIINICDGRVQSELKGHTGYILSIVTTSNRKLIISSSVDETIRIWDANIFEIFRVINNISEVVRSLALTSNDRFLVTGSFEDIRLWDLKFGKSCSVNAHNKKITCLHVSIDNRFVVTAGKDKTIRIWDFERKKQIECFGVESICIEKLAFRHDFKFLVSSSQDLVFMVWNTHFLVNYAYKPKKICK